MDRLMLPFPYLTAEDVIAAGKRHRAAEFEAMLRRDDARPLPPEPDEEPLISRLRSAAIRILDRLAAWTEGAGA